MLYLVYVTVYKAYKTCHFFGLERMKKASAIVVSFYESADMESQLHDQKLFLRRTVSYF